LTLSNVIELCRVMRHYLGAGLTLLDVFRQQAAKGPGGVRPVAARIVADLEKGSGLEEALKRHGDVFPPLFTALVSVGEQTGMLPEVFTELEKYYVRQQQLRNKFIAQTFWPILQFFAAVFVLAGLIFVMGLMTQQQEGMFALHFDPLGLGLSGPAGASLFLGVVFGTLLFFVLGYFILARLLRQQAAVDAVLLRVPVLGRCLRALALNRFCMALRLTLETGMPTTKALKLSFRATGNAAFVARLDPVLASVRDGDDLTAALTKSGLFPEDLRRILSVAEEAGRMDEVLRQQAEHYHEEAGRRLTVLTVLLSVCVWLFVGACIVLAIFRIALAYIDLINQAAT
jgi:type IV pilus assembly protein PilC